MQLWRRCLPCIRYPSSTWKLPTFVSVYFLAQHDDLLGNVDWVNASRDDCCRDSAKKNLESISMQEYFRGIKLISEDISIPDCRFQPSAAVCYLRCWLLTVSTTISRQLRESGSTISVRNSWWLLGRLSKQMRKKYKSIPRWWERLGVWIMAAINRVQLKVESSQKCKL